MKIRKTTPADLPRVMEIYALAREFMAAKTRTRATPMKSHNACKKS